MRLGQPAIALCATLLAAWAGDARATPPAIDAPSPSPGVLSSPGRLPKLRPTAAPAGVQSAFMRDFPALPPPMALPPQSKPAMSGPGDDAAREAMALHAAMGREVGHLLQPARRVVADTATRAANMLAATLHTIDAPQLVLVVDRNPAVQMLTLMLARPGSADGWRALGSAHVSTGQANRKDYYITPIGVFPHTDAILDFRAAGTRNEHHVRGLGLAGMRVWDFGWQWALKGWHTDGAGGDIRLQMHATDPDLLERKLGHPASEGCVRLSSTMNRFLDRYGVLDADYERVAATDGRYANLLSPTRTPTKLAGRLLIVIDTSLPPETPPTVASRPADWPDPNTIVANKAGVDEQPTVSK